MSDAFAWLLHHVRLILIAAAVLGAVGCVGILTILAQVSREHRRGPRRASELL